MPPDHDTVARAIDAVHSAARMALKAGNLTDYLSMFTPDLVFTQANGVCITRAQLARDYERQLKALDELASTHERRSLEVGDGVAVETIAQNGTAGVSAFFGLVRRRWSVERDLRYTWTRVDEEWLVKEVVVLRENVRGSRIMFGRQAN